MAGSLLSLSQDTSRFSDVIGARRKAEGRSHGDDVCRRLVYRDDRWLSGGAPCFSDKLMEEDLKTLPLENASILSEGSLQDGHRLWIGNLDPKITEYHLLKLLQKFGKVKQFDFLFHKSGPLEGHPRGYCFVNFETKVRYDNYKSEKVLPISLEPSSSTEPAQSTLSVSAKIKAIEAKLKMMSESPDNELPGQPSYSHFKASEKKRSLPYSRISWKSKR